MLALYVLSAILLIILFLLFKKFVLTILYEDNIVIVKVRIFVLDVKILRANIKKDTPPSTKRKFSFKEVWRFIKKFRRIYRDQKGNVLLVLSKAARVAKLHKYSFNIDYGFGNAAITGIAYGAIHGIASAADTVFRNAFGYQPKSELKVIPDYNENRFDVSVKLVVNTRIISIIKLGIYFLKIYKHEKVPILKILEED